jgi:hypothetical protein
MPIKKKKENLKKLINDDKEIFISSIGYETGRTLD